MILSIRTDCRISKFIPDELMKREVFDKRFTKRKIEKIPFLAKYDSDVRFSLAESCAADMGLTPGGRMRQEIYKDPFKLSDWDMDQKSRCLFILQIH